MRALIRTSTALLSGWIAGHLSLWFWADLPSARLLIGCCLAGLAQATGFVLRMRGLVYRPALRHSRGSCAIGFTPADGL